MKYICLDNKSCFFRRISYQNKLSNRFIKNIIFYLVNLLIKDYLRVLIKNTLGGILFI